MVIAAAARAAAQDVVPVPSIQLTLPSAHERWRAVAIAAAEEAAAIGRDWLGVHPSGAVSAIAIDPPIWQGRGAMFVERQAATAVVRSWWPPQLPDQRAAAMLDGFAVHLQTHAVERLFDRRYLRVAHRVESLPLFGAHVIWSVPTLRLSRWSAERHGPGDRLIARYAALFGTLERWLGMPALQAAMYEVARVPADRLTAAAIVATISQSSGQDLAWLFSTATDSSVTFDYAVADLSSTNAAGCAAPCFDTAVTVQRLGDGKFSGRSSAPVGEFESGDAMALQVTFANGEHASARWDGRDQARTIRFRSPSPAIAAHLDPERILLLDANYLNNAIVAPSATNAPVGKWMARWIVWMQNTMLSYGFFA